MAVPLGRRIAETRDANAAGQSSLDSSLNQPGREERQRYRHIDLSNAAFFPQSDLVDSDRAGHDLIKPTATACDRCDKRGTSLSTDRASIL